MHRTNTYVDRVPKIGKKENKLPVMTTLCSDVISECVGEMDACGERHVVP